MKILFYIDQDVMSKVAGTVMAIAEKMPDLIDKATAAKLSEAWLTNSVPLPDAVAEQIIRELWEELSGKRLSDSGPGVGDRNH